MSRFAAAVRAAVVGPLLLGACSDDPTNPDPGDTLPIVWSFDSGLEGWLPGAAATAANGGGVTIEGGEVILTGWGGPGEPDAWIARTVDLPPDAYTIRVRATADCVTQEGGGDSSLRIRLAAGGTTATLQDWTTIPEDAYATQSADLDEYAGESVTLRLEMDDEGGQEDGPDEFETLCIDEVQIIGD